MKAKGGRLGKEVAELTSLPKETVLRPEPANACEIIQRMFPESKQFPRSVKKRKLRFDDGGETDEMYDIPYGIIAHLTRECGGNVHDRHVVEATSGSFETETHGANPHSGAYKNDRDCAAKNATDLETVSFFISAYRDEKEDIPHTRNNWVCYDVKERRIVPAQYAIRTNSEDPGGSHLESWLVEMSVDGES
jgi:hypothetical protein